MTKRQGRYNRKYSQKAKSAALEALDRNEHNYYRTEKETGIPYSTLKRWERQRSQALLGTAERGLPLEGVTLGQQLEGIAYQLVAALPEKLEEANLHQTIEALKFVLEKVGQVEGDRSADVYEKLARLMDRYAAEKRAVSDSEPVDGG